MTGVRSTAFKTLATLLLVAAMLASLAPAQPAYAAVTQTEINDAIDEGVAWLVTQQLPNGSWPSDGGFAADTGFALGVLEHYAEHLGKKPLDATYVYHAEVQKGLDFLFKSAYYVAGNGWVYWATMPTGWNYDAYGTGPCLLGVARSGAPDAVVSGTSNGLDGKTYKQVAQMAVDWLGSAQIKNESGDVGAWYYRKDPLQLTGDQSATGWATLGLGYAVHSMGCTWPDGLLDRLARWNEEIQYHGAGPHFGGAGYMGPGEWTNVYKTGHLLFAQGLTGLTSSSPRVLDALTFMDTHWNDMTNGSSSWNDFGWRGNPPSVFPSYIATIAATKGFTELGIETFNGHDWYQDFADVIVPNQHLDGHWRGGGYGEFTDVRSTCWALLTLLRATSFVPPTATTKVATNVCMSTATLNGFLTSMGTSSAVNVSFEYGTSSGVYTKQTSGTTLAHAPASFSADVDGLAKDTTYYFRVKAEGDAVAYGNEMSFRTTSYPCNQAVDLLPPVIRFPDFAAWPGVSAASGTTVPDKGLPVFTVCDSTFGLQFTVEDDNPAGVQWSVTTSGRTAYTSSGTGAFVRDVQLYEGTNDVAVTAVDGAGNRTTRNLSISVDTSYPIVTLTRPMEKSIVGLAARLEGTVSDVGSGVASLQIAGVEVMPFVDGTFSVTIPLTVGLNEIHVESSDKAGNVGVDTWTVRVSTPPMRVRHALELTIGQKAVIIDGISNDIDVAPSIMGGRTFLPMRVLVEGVGGSISWNPVSRAVTIQARGIRIVLTIGRNVAVVSGKNVPIDSVDSTVVPVIVNGRTLLPLRFVAENLGLDVEWNAGLRTAIVTWE